MEYDDETEWDENDYIISQQRFTKCLKLSEREEWCGRRFPPGLPT